MFTFTTLMGSRRIVCSLQYLKENNAIQIDKNLYFCDGTIYHLNKKTNIIHEIFSEYPNKSLLMGEKSPFYLDKNNKNICFKKIMSTSLNNEQKKVWHWVIFSEKYSVHKVISMGISKNLTDIVINSNNKNYYTSSLTSIKNGKDLLFNNNAHYSEEKINLLDTDNIFEKDIITQLLKKNLAGYEFLQNNLHNFLLKNNLSFKNNSYDDSIINFISNKFKLSKEESIVGLNFINFLNTDSNVNSSLENFSKNNNLMFAILDSDKSIFNEFYDYICNSDKKNFPFEIFSKNFFDFYNEMGFKYINNFKGIEKINNTYKFIKYDPLFDSNKCAFDVFLKNKTNK